MNAQMVKMMIILRLDNTLHKFTRRGSVFIIKIFFHVLENSTDNLDLSSKRHYPLFLLNRRRILSPSRPLYLQTRIPNEYLSCAQG